MINDALQGAPRTIGLDVGDRTSQYCEIDHVGALTATGKLPTTLAGLERHFGKQPRCRVVLEVGTHSPWMARALAGWGHEVFVANPSAMYGARRRRKRNDRMDAEFLARQGRADPTLLHPIQHRRATGQEHLALLRARDQLVQLRSKLINHVRGSVKPLGARIPACGAEVFVKRATPAVPAVLQPSVAPLLDVIADLTQRVRQYDAEIAGVIQTVYPVAQRLQQPAGVGPLTALAFVLLIEDPARFSRSRDVT